MPRPSLLAALLALSSPAFAGDPAPPQAAEDSPRAQALKEYEAALRNQRRAQSLSDAAQGDYERTRAAKRLAAANDDLSAARMKLKGLGVPVPGGEKGRAEEELKVPEVGGGRAVLDPRVDVHSWVGEPGKGPRRPIDRPVVPPDSLQPSAADGGDGGAVIYGRIPGIGGAAAPNGRGGGGAPRERDAPEPEGGPLPGGAGQAPSLPRQRPVELPALGPVDDGLPARKGVDFIREALPWRPKIGARAAKAGRSDEERAALVRSIQRRLSAGDAARALDEAERLCALEPSDGGARQLKAMVLNRLERFSEAEAEAREALRLGAGDASVFETLAWAQLHLGQYAAAAESASAAIRLDPEATLAYVIRAWAYERMGQDGLRLADIRKAAAQRPGSFGVMAQAAQAGGLLSSPSGAASGTARLRDPNSRFPGLAVGLGALVGAGLLGAVLMRRRRKDS